MAPPKKIGIQEKNFIDIKNRLERLIRGVSSKTEEKLLPNDAGDVLDDILGAFKKTYDKGDNKSISEIRGKIDDNTVISDFIDAQFNQDRYKEAILNNIMHNTIDKIREQQFMIRNMPQISKVITSMVNSIMSPSTQTNETTEIYMRHREITPKDVMDILTEKKYQEKERKCVINGLSYGAGFLMIYPYREMAANILDMANIAKAQTTVNPNLMQAAYLSENKKLISEALYGSTGEIKADDDIEFSEAHINTFLKYASNTYSKKSIDDKIQLISECVNNGEYDNYDTSITSLVTERFFTESPIDNPAIYQFKDRLFGESGRNVDMKKLKGMKGAYVKALEEDKTIPVYINNELVGVYYVDYDTDFSEARPDLKRLDRFSSKVNSKLSSLTTLGIAGDIKEAIIRVLKGKLDERFLMNNKHVLPSIEKLVRDTKLDYLDEHFMIRWIPKKYVVEFANHDRKSQIANVEPFITCWIILFRHYMMRKLFYEKDLRYIKYLVSDGDDDFASQGFRALQAAKSIIPSPADILNYRNMTLSIINSNRVAIPSTRDGATPFTMEKLDGQKPDEYIMDDLIRLQSIITEEIGFNYNMLDPATQSETATQIIATREDKAELIINKQIQFNMAKSEAINKILKYELELNDLEIFVRFPEVKVQKQAIFTDFSEKLNAQLDNIINNLGIVEPGEMAHVRAGLYRKYVSTKINLTDVDELREEYKFKMALGTDGVGVGAAPQDIQ